MNADKRQVGGSHYKKDGGEQHWDRVHRLGLNWFAANVTKYVERYKEKNGLQDLEKARHYLDKLIEVEAAKLDDGSDPVARGYVNQDEFIARPGRD